MNGKGLDGLAEFGLDGGARQLAGEGRQVILQRRQIGGDLVSHQV